MTSAFSGLDKWAGKSARLISFLLVALPFIYLPGYGAYAVLKYGVLGTASLVLGYFALQSLLANRHLAGLLLRVPLYSVVVYLAAYALTSFTGIDPITSLFSTFTRTDGWFTFLFLFLFLVSAYLVVAQGGVRIVRLWLTLSVISAAALSLLITLSPDGLDVLRWGFLETTRGGGTIGNSSLAVIYITWNIFFAAFLAITTKQKEVRSWLIGAGAFMLASPLFIHWRVLIGRLPADGLMSYVGDARAGAISLFIGAIIAGCVWLMRDIRIWSRRVGYMGIAIVLGATLFFGTQLLDSSSTLHQQFIEVAGRNRFLFWESSLKGFKERPLVGFGPNTFFDVYHRDFDPSKFSVEEAKEGLVDEPHNIFFESLVSGGIILTLALLFYLGAFLHLLTRLSKSDRMLGSVMIGAWAAWLFQMQFIFDGITSMMLQAIVFAVALALTRGVSEGTSSHPLVFKTKAIQIAYVLVAVILFVYAVYLPVKKARMIQRVYETNLPARAAMWSSLSGISPMGDQYDSALTFNNVFNAYIQQASSFRADNGKLKEAVLAELKAIDEYLGTLVVDEESRLELAFLEGQFHYMRMFISNRFSIADIERLDAIAQKALANSPRDTRIHFMIDTLQKFKSALPKK